MTITRLSSKGQIIIPQSIRRAHKWQIGLEFNIIDTEYLVITMSPYKETEKDKDQFD